MLKSSLNPVVISLLFLAGSTSIALAQDRPSDIAVKAQQLTQTVPARKIVRVVEPVPYWVEAKQLRVRDNPYAGDVVGMLEVGQKIQARKTIDDWVLISAPGQRERWVNRNFLSLSPVTWANYAFGSDGGRNLGENRFGNAKYDIKKKRIKVSGVKDVKVYAADIKRLSGEKKLIVSRHDFRAGAYFEKRLVQCSGDAATHAKILGEGYTVMMMEADPRKQQIGQPMSDADQVNDEGLSAIDKAIANFTCETDKL